MARRPFGGTTADVAQDVAGDRVAGAQVTVWTAATGGTKLTDLQTPTGVALAGGVVTSDANGIIAFLGPSDGTAVVYLDGGLGGRTKMIATDLADRVGTLESTPGGVTSVAGRTGVVVLVKGDVGLGNVDNTADTAKPVSTAQQAALDLKANLASPTFTGTPTVPTAAPGTNTTQTASTAFVAASGGSSVASVKTADYTAAAGDYVPVDTTSGNRTVTLPTAPPDKTQVGIKHVVRGGTNTVTIACGGSDVLNKTGGATTGTLTLVNQSATMQYKASTGVWYVIGGDLPLSQLDSRYVARVTNAQNPVTGWFHVDQYGAALDGTTNDRVAYQAALTAAAAVGGVVYHPAGKTALVVVDATSGTEPTITPTSYHAIRYGLLVASGVSVLGGMGSAVKMTRNGAGGSDNSCLFGLNNGTSRVRFEGLAFDGGATGTVAEVEHFGIMSGAGCSDITIVGNEFYGWKGKGILALDNLGTVSSARIKIKNNYFHDIASQSAHVLNCADLDISDNVSRNNLNATLGGAEAWIVSNCDGLTFRNNHVRNWGTALSCLAGGNRYTIDSNIAISFATAGTSPLFVFSAGTYTNLKVTGNQVDTSTAPANVAGIGVSSVVGLVKADFSGNQVAANSNAGSYGIVVTPSAASTDVSLNGNLVSGNGIIVGTNMTRGKCDNNIVTGGAIDVRAGVASVRGNIVDGATQPLKCQADDCLIVGNHLTATGAAGVASVELDANRISFVGNRVTGAISDNAQGLFFINGAYADTRISGNHFRHTGAGRTFGWENGSATGTVLEDNTFTHGSGSTPALNLFGSGQKVKNNRGWNFNSANSAVGPTSVTPAASPWTYTAGKTPETLILTAGTVSGVVKNSVTLGLTTPASIPLEPGEAVVVTYSVAPTAVADRK